MTVQGGPVGTSGDPVCCKAQVGLDLAAHEARRSVQRFYLFHEIGTVLRLAPLVRAELAIRCRVAGDGTS